MNNTHNTSEFSTEKMKEDILSSLRIHGFFTRRTTITYPPFEKAIHQLIEEGYLPKETLTSDDEFYPTKKLISSSVVREVKANKIQKGFRIGTPCERFKNINKKFFEVQNDVYKPLGIVTDIQIKTPRRNIFQFLSRVKLEPMAYITLENKRKKTTIVVQPETVFFKER